MMSIFSNRMAIWVLIGAALLVRALVPAGWMPDTGQPDVIVAKMCNSDQTVTIPLNRDQVPEPDGHDRQEPCAFGGLAGAALLPELPIATLAPLPADQLRIAALIELALLPPAHVLPPGRGPPLLS